MADIKTVSLADAMASNSVWEPCKPYLSLFEKHAKSNGLPAILVRQLSLPPPASSLTPPPVACLLRSPGVDLLSL